MGQSRCTTPIHSLLRGPGLAGLKQRSGTVLVKKWHRGASWVPWNEQTIRDLHITNTCRSVPHNLPQTGVECIKQCYSKADPTTGAPALSSGRL